jgi:hypothetical protein
MLLALALNLSAQSIHPYRTTGAISLAQKLFSPYARASNRMLLTSLLREIAIEYELDVWIDRRIATDTLISLSGREATLGEAIQAIAEQANAAVAHVDNLILLVPPDRLDSVEAAHWELSTSKSIGSAGWGDRCSMSWIDGSEPRELIDQFATKYRVTLPAELVIEHDLWRGWDFRPTLPSAVSVCLLSGFDLRIDSSTDSPSVVPIKKEFPAPVVWIYRDEILTIGSDRLKEWKKRWPAAAVKKLEGNQKAWEVACSASAHRDLVASLIPKKKWERPKSNETKLYTGEYRGPLQSILDALAAQTKLQLESTSLPDRIARQEIEVQFEKATIDDVLKAIGEKAGIKLQRRGQKLEILIE